MLRLAKELGSYLFQTTLLTIGVCIIVTGIAGIILGLQILYERIFQ